MKVLVAGDFCPRGRVEREFESGNYDIVLNEIVPHTRDVDYSIVNLECPVGYGNEIPITKCGPNLRCGISGVRAIKYAGFSCVTLANNHFYDYGQEGVENTISACQHEDLETVGGGKNLRDASSILYKKIGDESLAVINCCEHEYSIATKTTGGSNPLNPIQQFYSIKEARKKADYVLVIVHGGHEHFQLPSLRMRELYRFFIDSGADAVVNHHQHCYSGYEVYKGKPVFYGLGNFCFDSNPPTNEGLWNEGYLVEIEFIREGISYKIYPYVQCSNQPMIKMLPKDAFTENLKKLNDIICDDDKLQRNIESYYKKTDSDILTILEPFQNHYIRVLQNRKLLPMFVSPRWLNLLRNYILCESHKDKVEHFLLNAKL